MNDEARFPKIRVVGGPDGSSIEVYRDGVRQWGIVEFQINGSVEGGVTAIFKEVITFDGAVEVLPKRKTGLDA